MKTIKKVPLGKTGEMVSQLCLGAMYFGSRTDEKNSYAVLADYVEAGGSFIDTANMYFHLFPGCAGGESETLLGRWMKEQGNRKGIFIASKVGFEYPGTAESPGAVRGVSPSQIAEECNKSLKRLQIETLDLYYVHYDDRRVPMEDLLEAMNKLVEAGKVRYLGASNYLAWRLMEAKCICQTKGWAEYCCVQQRYSYIRNKPGTNFDPQIAVNDDLLDFCRVSDTTLLAYSPFIKGTYVRKDVPFPEQYLGPDSDNRLAALNKVAQGKRATLHQIILAWMMHSDPVCIPLVAASTSTQMQENLGALDIQLTPSEVKLLTDTRA